MSQLLPFIIVGFTAGSLYGLAGTGLVLTYKTSGIFNFAHGAIAAAGAFAFYQLHDLYHVPWPIAFVVAVVAVALIGGGLIERVARRLTNVRPAMSIVATVGILLAIQGGLQARFGYTTRQFPSFLPKGGVQLGSVLVSYEQIITAAVAAAAAVGLFLFFTRTRMGASMRAVVDNPELLDLAGTDPARVRMASWIIGCGFAALTGVLIGPTLGLEATLLTLLVVQAFGATAIGRFSSLTLTYAGGLVIGIGSALLTRYVSSNHTFSGLPSSLPFIVLFVVLIATPRAKLANGRSRRRLSSAPRPVPRQAVWGGAALAALIALGLPNLVGTKLPVYTNAATFVLIFASLALLVWTSGQISLCHAAFAAVGASSFAHLTTGAHLPWLLALALAGLATVPLGAMLTIPAIRLAGVYLALATFGFGILMERVVYGTGFMFGATDLRSATRPDFGLFSARSDKAFFYVVVTIAVLGCVAVAAVARSRLGRLLRALSETPLALTTNGLSVNVTRVLVFCISAFLAGVAGALFIAAAGNGSGRAFGSSQSLIWLAALALCGTRLLPSSIAAAVVFAILPSYLPHFFTDHQALVFGLSAIFAALASDGGLAMPRLPATSGGPAGAGQARPGPIRARLVEAGAS